MIEIDGKIVSTDLLTECFACDIARCKGMCCVEGNAGAPAAKWTRWTFWRRSSTHTAHT